MEHGNLEEKNIINHYAKWFSDELFSESLDNPSLVAAKITVSAEGLDYRNYNDTINHEIRMIMMQYDICVRSSVVLAMYQPHVHKNDERLMAIYTSLKRYSAKDGDGVVTYGKPGVMIKHLIPGISEIHCNEFSKWWKETISLNKADFVVKESIAASDFALAYSARVATTLDPNFKSGVYKSLSGSCMQGRFNSGMYHPAEAYASGDFSIVTAWLGDTIAARVLVSIATKNGSVERYIPGPVYTTSDKASAAIDAHLESNPLFTQRDRDDRRGYDWRGSRLQINMDDSGCAVVPYLDGDYQEVDSDGSFLTITSNGDYSLTSTCGELDLEGLSCCDRCGSRITEDDSTYVDDYGRVCESCLSEDFVWSEKSGEYFSKMDCIECYSQRWNGAITSTFVHNSDIGDNYVYCENSNEYWYIDDVVYIESEGIWVSPPELKEDYFQSDMDYEYYPNRDKVETNNLVDLTEDQAKRGGYIFSEGKNLWIEPEDQETYIWNEETEEYQLKDHLEIDESGNVINRQLSFLIAAE